MMNDTTGFDPGYNPDCNPFLARLAQAGSNQRATPAGAAQRGSIDPPQRAVGGGAENLIWQTRDHAPTEYENRLADAIEAGFEAGADSAAAMAEQLNGRGVHAPDGAPFSADSFAALMRELGA